MSNQDDHSEFDESTEEESDSNDEMQAVDEVSAENYRYGNDEDYEWWEIMREHLMERYFPYVLFYDLTNEDVLYQPLQPPTHIRQSVTGWLVFEADDYVLTTPGESAFAEYGHRKALIDTVNDVCDQELAHKPWVSIMAKGVTDRVSAAAWVLLDAHSVVETTAFPPTELADQLRAQCKVFEEVAELITTPTLAR